MLLSDKPDIVIATPSRALALLQSKILSLFLLKSLVIDEADLILSYGHDEDVRQIFSGGYLPKVFQSAVKTTATKAKTKNMASRVVSTLLTSPAF